MRTTYAVHPQRAIAGMSEGAHIKTRPAQLPEKSQIDTVTIANSEAGTLTLTLTDSRTSQVYTLDVTVSGTTEATTLNEMVAAWRADGKFNDLATVVEDGATVLTATFRQGGQAYTLTTTPPGSMTAVVAITQVSGNTGMEFGLLAAYGSANAELQPLSATSIQNDLIGATMRTDMNHFQDIPPGAEDITEVGKHLTLQYKGLIWLQAEEAMTFRGPIHIRRALTSGSGTVGAVRATPAGTAHVVELTPIVNMSAYRFSFDYLGASYEVSHDSEDATITVALAIDNLVANAGTIAGVTITDNTTAFTLTAAIGTTIDNVQIKHSGLDAGTASMSVTSAGTPDADTILLDSDKAHVVDYHAGLGLALVSLGLAE